MVSGLHGAPDVSMLKISLPDRVRAEKRRLHGAAMADCREAGDTLPRHREIKFLMEIRLAHAPIRSNQKIQMISSPSSSC